MLHELDNNRYYTYSEPDHARSENPTDTTYGELVGEWIEDWINETGNRFPADTKYLGLAAGRGYSEMHIAERFGIKPANVTLVDRYFRPQALARFSREYPELQAIELGMFEFLENPPTTDFSLVTAIGVEYAFDNPAAAEAFIAGLPRVMRPGGIAAIFPSGSADPTPHLEAHGLQPINPYSGFSGRSSLLIYRLGATA